MADVERRKVSDNVTGMTSRRTFWRRTVKPVSDYASETEICELEIKDGKLKIVWKKQFC